MFGENKNIQKNPPAASPAPGYDQKVDPMKELLTDCARIIGKEVKNNEKLNEKKDFELIVRNFGKSNKDVMHLRSIKKEDLENILQKITKWNKDESASKLPLQPREIEAMQQIVNAIEKKELVIRQKVDEGSDGVPEFVLISQADSEVYNAIIDQHAVIEKAGNLARQKIIGTDAEGNIVLGDKDSGEQLGEVYDALDGEVDMKKAFKGKTVFDTSEYALEEEEAMPGRARRESYTAEFNDDADTLQRNYQNLSQQLKEKYEESTSAQEGSESRQKSVGSSGEARQSDKEKRLQDPAQTMADKVRHAARRSLRLEERQKDEQARLEEERNERLEDELDQKADRIEEEQERYESRKEQRFDKD